MSRQHCKNYENYDVKWEAVHCYPLLHVMAGISAQFSNFAFVLFCYITNHLMTGPLGNSEFCFPRISMFPETKSREKLRFEGNKIRCSPRDQSLRDLLYSKTKQKQNLKTALRFQPLRETAVIISQVTVNCYTLNIHLMYSPEGNSSFCFPESPDVSRDEVEGNIRTRGKTKLTSFPRDHTLSV